MYETTWRELISDEMLKTGESFDDIVSCTLTDKELDVEFDNGYGGSEGRPFTLWTANFVYFPLVYDGAEWVGSVPRNPNGVATEHLGSE